MKLASLHKKDNTVDNSKSRVMATVNIMVTVLLCSVLIGCENETKFTCPDESQPVQSKLGSACIVPDPLRLVVVSLDKKLLFQSKDAGEAGGVVYSAFGFSTTLEPELDTPTFDDHFIPSEMPTVNDRHMATGIQKIEKTGEGTTYLLSTDDPNGALIKVALQAENDGSIVVNMQVDQSERAASVYLSFGCAPGEAFHGFGGRREGTNLRGTSIANWIFDYRFPDVTTTYYYPQSMYLSSAGYALWLDTARMARFRMASDLDTTGRISVRHNQLRAVIVPAGGKKGIAAITKKTGRHRVPPAWSMGPTISRAVQVGTETAASYLERVNNDVKVILEGHFPVDAYAYEGWVLLPVERVREINTMLRARGIHPILYIRSFLSDDIAGTEPVGRIAEGIEKGYVATDADGQPYIFRGPFEDDSALVDFTNPEAKEWWKGFVREMLELGADGFMNDFGEQVEDGMHFADGSDGRAMHNLYSVLQHQAAREAVDEFVADHPEREIYFYIRAGYNGSAAFEDATFPGDESVDDDQFTGLPSIVPEMLNRAIFGAFGFSTNIGGYADYDFKGTTKELFMRWTEAAVFMTHFRVHNSAITGVRMPWSYDTEVKNHFNEMAKLHTRAIPLMRRLWEDATVTGIPPIRPLYLEYPELAGNVHNDDEWLVGSDVLVAPVLTVETTEREVLFPEGCWQQHGEGKSILGPTNQIMPAPLGTLLWFTRCGTIPFDLAAGK